MRAALHVRDNRGYPVPGYAHARILQNFKWAFIRMNPVNVLAKAEVRVPQILAIDVLGGGYEPPILGKRRRP